MIGLSTAYYLALKNQKDGSTSISRRSDIFVIDSSAKLCTGASGQSEGVLGDFGFEDDVGFLALLPYQLHTQLTTENRSRELYGYSELIIHTVFSDGYNPAHPKLPFPVVELENLSQFPQWLNVSHTWEVGLIANGSYATRLWV